MKLLRVGIHITIDDRDIHLHFFLRLTKSNGNGFNFYFFYVILRLPFTNSSIAEEKIFVPNIVTLYIFI